jgi:hypothetical protein
VLGAHHLALASASALDLTFAAMALSLGSPALATSATAFHALGVTATAAALGLDLTSTAATLRLGLSATTTFCLGLTVSAVAPIGLRGCWRGNREGRDTGRENEVPHLESPDRFAVTTTRDTRRSTLR